MQCGVFALDCVTELLFAFIWDLIEPQIHRVQRPVDFQRLCKGFDRRLIGKILELDFAVTILFLVHNTFVAPVQLQDIALFEATALQRALLDVVGDIVTAQSVPGKVQRLQRAVEKSKK